MPSLRKSLLLCAAVISILAFMAGCGESKAPAGDFTALYDKAMTLKHGQTEAEVIALLGEPKERSTGSPENGIRFVYHGESAKGSNLIIVIKDGKVFSGLATKNGSVIPFATAGS